MEPGDLERLREAGTVTTVDAGRIVIERGQHGAGLFVILEGTVSVEAPDASRELGPGSVVGTPGASVLSDSTSRSPARNITDVCS